MAMNTNQIQPASPMELVDVAANFSQTVPIMQSASKKIGNVNISPKPWKR